MSYPRNGLHPRELEYRGNEKDANSFHVRRMSTHVTDDDCAEILFKRVHKIVQISPVAYTDLTKNWNTFRVDHR